MNGLRAWNECVRHRTTREAVVTPVWFSSPRVRLSYINLEWGGDCVRGSTGVHGRAGALPCMCVRPPLALPLGRRQSQPQGGGGVHSLAAPMAPQVYLGAGEKHFDPRPASLRVPQREAAQPCNLYWIYSFPIYRPCAPPRRGSLNCTLPVPRRQHVMIHTR